MNININDLVKAPKQFLENVSGGFSQEFFILAALTGVNATVYALTPQHMKRIAQWATNQVSEYEKKHGKIEAEWNPAVQSPIQASDLSSPQDESSDKGSSKK